MLGKASAGNHADHCLPQHFLMTAKDSVCGMSTARSCGQFHLLACEGLDGDLLHANSVPTRNDAGRSGVRVGRRRVTAHARCMPFLQPRNSLGVMIIVSLLLGCSAPEDTGGAKETPSTNQQISSELIAFVSDREGSDALFVMRSDGSGVRRLTEDLPAVSHPAWSSDGQRIAFNAGSPTLSDIYLINLDGSGLTKITSEARAPTSTPPGRQTALDWPSAPTATATGTSM